ncbi:MAG TPA: hypothetical protein VFS21_03050 [Roseiflexaceae bacterium]|nr:hypothetical protein [Roseiflexaceae bacterium]
MIREAPISRDWVDVAAPWLRGALGAAFVAYSANSTIFIGAADLMWLFPRTAQTTIMAFADAYWYSLMLAIVLFGGEVVCSERWRGAYRFFLVPDAFYTARGLWFDLSAALGVLLQAVAPPAAASALGMVIATPIALLVGYFVARWGETLLFGERRQFRQQQQRRTANA